uniref:Exo-alpha-sialidase n=1 Tax=candidate division WOR-3 bacterium TaxID=2052148 RepID=A0A7V6CN52_UNCW3
MVIIFFLIGQWVTVGIDTILVNSNAKYLTMQSLVLDSFNTLHAIWHERVGNYYQLFYSYKKPDSTWSSPLLLAETANPNGVIAVTPNGKVHIAYTSPIVARNELYYLTNHYGNFIKIRITNDTLWDYSPTIAFRDSFVHIVWIKSLEGSGYKLYYLWGLPHNFQIVQLRNSQLGDFGLGAAPYLTISPEGICHVSYRGGNYPEYHIHHAENSFLGDTNFSYEVLTTINLYDYHSAIYAQANGELFLSVSGDNGFGSRKRTCYLYRPPNSREWQPYQLMTDTNSAEIRSLFVKNNKVHITWERINGNLRTQMIYHCSNFTNNWLNSEVLADGRSQSGSLIIDNQNMGYLLIAHQDGSNYQLLCLKSRPFVGIAERQDQRKLRKIVNLKKKKVDKFFYDITGKKVRNLKRGIYFENPFY